MVATLKLSFARKTIRNAKQYKGKERQKILLLRFRVYTVETKSGPPKR